MSSNSANNANSKIPKAKIALAINQNSSTPLQVAQHIVVFGHIPPFIDSPDEPAGYFNWDVKTRSSFMDTVKKNNVRACFFGHYHRNAGGMDGDTEVVVSAAVGVNLVDEGDRLNLPVAPADPQIGGSVSGLRVVTISKGSVAHTYYTLDKVLSDPLPTSLDVRGLHSNL